MAYAVTRVLLGIVTLFGVALLVFIALRMLPGDVAVAMLGDQGSAGEVYQQQLQALRQQLGLNKPIYEQFGAWIWGAVRGNFGDSYFYNVTIASLLPRKAALSIEVGLMAFVIGTAIAIPFGIICAIKQDSWFDYVLRIFSVGGLSLPAFWIAMLIVLVLVRYFHWLPPLGYKAPWDNLSANLQQLIWPALAVGYHNSAFTLRLTRSMMLEVLREDYVRTARAKGLAEQVVIYRHVLRNAMVPVITFMGLQVAVLITGLITIERVFNLPGIGTWLVESIGFRDYPATQALILFIAFVVVGANLIVDLIYGWVDPRIRYS